MTPPRGWDRLRLILGIAGLLVSAYLTLVHFDSHVPLACAAGSFVNCETVLSSRSAVVLGVPVAAWGLVWFAGAIAMAVLSLRTGGRGEPAGLRRVGLAWPLLGTAGVLWLVYQEVGVIGRICAWCTVVHAIILALLVIQVLTDARRAPGAAPA